MSQGSNTILRSTKREADDLDIALRYVIGRIEEEASQTGKPLTDEERALLLDLPADSLFGAHVTEPEIPLVVPRDLAFERLCALVKTAHTQDLQLDPNDRNWQLAKAVTELHRHPMAWLLGWSGIKIQRPWWDGFLLIVTALVSISVWMALMFVGFETEIPFHWLIAAIGCAALVTAMGFGTRWMSQSLLRRAIERCRRR
jgi:hypothetical protein